MHKFAHWSRRAGVPVDSPVFETLVAAISTSRFVDIHGFYCHAGNAYASTSLGEATNFLTSEVVTVNAAAKKALELFKANPTWAETQSDQFVLSVGSTPTAHAASGDTKKLLSEYLHGSLELHAGE